MSKLKLDFFWTSNICCIVTGASRGFGKEICLSLAKRFLDINRSDLNKKISFILIARDSGLLDELQRTLNSLSPNVHCTEVIKGSLDESATLKSFENALRTYCEIGPQYDHSLLIHNAGSLGDPNRLVSDYSTDDQQLLTDYAELNLLSFIKMTSIFLNAFPSSAQKTLVNVTSLLAIQPYKGLALYGSIKAARDAFFRSVALERPDVRCLSYAPGILNTAMAETLKKEGYNREIFEVSTNVLEPRVSAEKMIRILEESAYTNGQHIDFYDC